MIALNSTNRHNTPLLVHKGWRWLLISACLMLAPSIYAARSYFSVNGLVGYQGTVYSLNPSAPMGKQTWGNGCMANVGMGYELGHRHFIFSIGLGIGYGNSWSIYQHTEHIPGQNDNDGGSINDYDNTYAIDRNTSSTWSYHRYRVTAPLFFGMQFSRFYAKFGAVLSFPFGGSFTEKGVITDRVKYDAFESDFNNHPLAPNQTSTFDATGKGTFSMLQVSPAFEIGCTFLGYNSKYRLGIYGEFGILSLNAPSAVSATRYWSFLQSGREMQIGIRFTYLIPGRQRGFPCRCETD